MKSIKIGDVITDNLKITNINMHVINNSTDNVKVKFNETANGMGISVDNTFLNTTLNWQYEKGGQHFLYIYLL